MIGYLVAVRFKDGNKGLYQTHECSSEKQAVKLVSKHVGANWIAVALVGLPVRGRSRAVLGEQDKKRTKK